MHKIAFQREERPTPSPSRNLVSIGRIERLAIQALESVTAGDHEETVGALARIIDLAREIGR
jgi:hypothetical protein